MPTQITNTYLTLLQSKPNSELEETHTMGDKSYLTLLRGIPIPGPPPTVPSPVPPPTPSLVRL
jgi:hypothetical protein